MRAFRTAIVLAAVALLAACGTEPGTGPGDAPGGPLDVKDKWISCEAEAPEPPFAPGAEDPSSMPRLSADFTPIAVVVCTRGQETRADGSMVTTALEQRADDIAALVAALRLPDQPRTTGFCTMDLPAIEWFALLDAEGRWVHPGVPADACAKVRIEVRDAMLKLKRTTVKSRVDGEILSKEAAASGCSQGYADMVSVETTQPSTAQRRSLGALPFARDKQLRLCVYTVPKSEQGNGKPAGDFAYGLVLPDQRRGPIERALLAAGPAKDCSQHANRFALLRSVDAGGEVYVELDGCLRILATPLDGGHSLAQGDAALAALLGKE